MNYYNENDPNAADWLENLMFAGLIPWGRVDRRSIRDAVAHGAWASEKRKRHRATVWDKRRASCPAG